MNETNSTLKKSKAILFDLDGTLWNSSAEVVAAWNIALARHPELDRQITPEEMRGWMGKTMDVIAELMLPHLACEKRMAVLDECTACEHEYLAKHGARLYPNVISTLTQLRDKYMLCIVSNCQDGYIQCFLDHFGLWDTFCDMECWGRTGKSKGENISMVIKRRGAQKAFYLGDTQGDLDAADLAGIPFVHAAYGFGKTNRPTEKITDFSQLVQAAQNLLDNSDILL